VGQGVSSTLDEREGTVPMRITSSSRPKFPNSEGLIGNSVRWYMIDPCYEGPHEPATCTFGSGLSSPHAAEQSLPGIEHCSQGSTRGEQKSKLQGPEREDLLRHATHVHRRDTAARDGLYNCPNPVRVWDRTLTPTQSAGRGQKILQ